MKKIITLGLLALSTVNFARARKTFSTPVRTGKALPAIAQVAQKGTGTLSEVFYPASFGANSACANTIYTYRDSTFGYYAGVNTYGDKELLMRYKLSDLGAATPAVVDTVLAFFGAKYVGSNGLVFAKVYSADVSGAPATLLGTSTGKSVSSLDTMGNATSFTFLNPIALTTNQFFVSIDVSALYATSDTVGLFSTDGSCTTTDPTGAWTKESDDNFYAFSDTNNNWGYSPDLAIFAHVNANTLAVGHIANNTFGATAFPVPASGALTIAFTAQDNSPISISLKDITVKPWLSRLLMLVKAVIIKYRSM